MNLLADNQLALTRREFLGRGGTGIGAAALASLLGPGLGQAAGGGRAGFPQIAAKAKRVIYLTQSGAPSHTDLFDYKPGLQAWRGKELPPSVRMGQRLTTMTAKQKLAIQPTEFKFSRHGQSGAWLSELLPGIGAAADEICFIKSMHTEAINHSPGMTLFMTGSQIPGRPSMGAWLNYGLGSVSQELPGYVVMMSRDQHGTCGQLLFDYYYGSGFLPSRLQGVKFRTSGEPVLYLSNPKGVSREVRRGLLDDLAKLNEMKFREVGDPEITTRISQYEMAYRMQMSVPELTDLSDEPDHVFDLYGKHSRTPGTYAANCILARRLAERGVRFIQLFHVGWDTHGSLSQQLRMQCDDTDMASGALIQDLRMRGLLEDTSGDLGRGIRPHAVRAGRGGLAQVWPRPPRSRLHGLDGRGWGEAGLRPRRDGRLRLQRRPRPGACARFSGHNPASARHRSRAVDLQVPRPPPPADRRARPSGATRPLLTACPLGQAALACRSRGCEKKRQPNG